MMHGLTFRTVLGLLVVAVLGTGGYLRWASVPNPAYAGITMGTDYHIRIAGRVKRSDLRRITRQIDNELTKINKEMSTWDPASEIERFSLSRTTEPVKVSEDFATVVARSLHFSQITNGAFDPTLEPLLDLWGFGSGGNGLQVPTDAEIAVAKAKTG